MNKIKPTDVEIHDLLQRRWSPRAFDGRPIEPDRLRRIFEAARWAPSCYNEQPWRFVVGQKEAGEEYQKLFGLLAAGNQAWCSTAAVLVLVCARKTFSHNDKDNGWHLYDAGQAAAHLTVQAMAEGIFVHQMAGFDAAGASEMFQLSEIFCPVTMIALGYPGDVGQLPENLRSAELAPGSRRPAREVVFEGEWEKTASFVENV